LPVSFLGIIGDDSSGSFLRTELETANVNCNLKTSKKFQTAVILTIVESDGERSFIINGKSQDDLEWNDLPLTDILGSHFFYTSAYTIKNDPIKSVIKQLIQHLKNVEKTPPKVIFNLAAYTTVEKCKMDIESDILPYTDILIGNRDEFSLFSNSNQPDALNVCKKIKEQFPNLDVVLLTDGSNGCYFLGKDQKGHVPAPKVPVIDTTGAGDGFSAGFIAGYVSEKDFAQSIKQGVTLGSSICQGYGARYIDFQLKF
jgi:sugar/nucleoside kinase (ribokinase family)